MHKKIQKSKVKNQNLKLKLKSFNTFDFLPELLPFDF